jgi:hypothetical protein
VVLWIVALFEQIDDVWPTLDSLQNFNLPQNFAVPHRLQDFNYYSLAGVRINSLVHIGVFTSTQFADQFDVSLVSMKVLESLQKAKKARIDIFRPKKRLLENSGISSEIDWNCEESVAYPQSGE